MGALNNYSSNPNKGKSGGGTGTYPKPKKSFGELGEEVKANFFKQNFAELLLMSKTHNLDSVLQSIETFVMKEGKSLSTSQLRNIYDKAIKADTVNELKLIRPNLAYLAGRSTNESEKSLLSFIDLIIKNVVTDEQVNEFHIFFESVVAYHKFYGKQ